MAKWNHNLSTVIRTAGAVPFMFLVFAPSLILIGFNIYFNLAVFDSISFALDLNYSHAKKLKAIVFMASILLIMKPLIETLFKQTGTGIDDTEKSYLKMMKFVSIGILGFGGLIYLITYLFFDIKVPVYQPNPNASFFESSMIETDAKKEISFFDFMIDLFVIGLSYFTETLAGFLLITVKDILFPEFDKSDNKPKAITPEVKTLNPKCSAILKDIDKYLSQTPEQVRTSFIANTQQIKNEINRIKTFNVRLFEDFEDKRNEFAEKLPKVLEILEKSLLV